jgi:hypothetical protein
VLLSQEVAASGVAFLLTVQSSMATPSHTASGVCLRQSSYFKQASTESNALVSVAVTQ